MSKLTSFQFNSKRYERILILAQTDFAVRYYGSYLGLIWAFINPFAQLVVYYLAFNFIMKMGNGATYALYIFSGILIWTAFAQGTKSSLAVSKSKRYLLQNIQINKADIYISHTITVFIGLLFNLLSFFVMSLFFDLNYGIKLLFIPLLLLQLFVLVYSSSVILSILNSFMMDLNHLWDIAMLAGFWSVPIIWDQAIVYGNYQFIMYVNPVTGILMNFRNTILTEDPVDISLFIYDSIYILILFIVAYFLLKYKSYKLADLK